MESRSKILMQSLIYPAVLGSFLFAFLQHTSSFELAPFNLRAWCPLYWPWGQQEWLGTLLLVYFGTLYVETEATRAESYGIWTFLLDVVEVGSMMVAFRSLGFFGASVDSVRWFYLASAAAFACPIVWRRLVAERWKDFYTGLSATAIVIAILRAWHGQHEVWSTTALWLLLLLYVTDLIVVWAVLGYRKTGTPCLVKGTYRPSNDADSLDLGILPKATFGSYPHTVDACTWKLMESADDWRPMSILAICTYRKYRRQRAAAARDGQPPAAAQAQQ